MSLQTFRDGIGHRQKGLLACLFVSKYTIVGVEKVVGLADRDAEFEPIAGGSDCLGGDTVSTKPLIHQVDGFIGWFHIFLDLRRKAMSIGHTNDDMVVFTSSLDRC